MSEAQRKSAGAPRGAAGSTQETDDPMNRLLDAFEAHVEAMLANGLEAQLRARLARLLPAPAARAGGAWGAGALPIQSRADLNLMAMSGAVGLRALAKRQRLPASVKQLSAYADTLALVADLTKGDGHA